jgi:hypothetical protein
MTFLGWKGLRTDNGRNKMWRFSLRSDDYQANDEFDSDSIRAAASSAHGGKAGPNLRLSEWRVERDGSRESRLREARTRTRSRVGPWDRLVVRGL